MAIKTIRDLVNLQLQVTNNKQNPVKAPNYAPRVTSTAAAEFLGHKIGENIEDKFSNRPVSLRKQIEENNFVKPDNHFSTPTLLKRFSKSPDAFVEVAKAHTVMSNAELQAQLIQNNTSNKSPQEIFKETTSSSFSQTPRLISKLIG